MFKALSFLLSVILLASVLIYHSYKMRGSIKTSVFVIISGSIGLIVELVGVTSGGYGYIGYTLIMVNLLTTFGWIANVYLAMHLTLVILDKYCKDVLSPKEAFQLGLIAGLIGVIYDLFTDPVSTALKIWTWSTEGFWFGVPVQNFIGWYLILSFSITGYHLTLFYGKTNKQKFILALVVGLVSSIIIMCVLMICSVT